MHAFSNRHLVRCLAACIAALSITACGQSPTSGNAAAASAAGSNPPVAAPAGDASAGLEPDSPCRLLTTVEVAAVFPGTRAGQPERSREEYGIKACEWSPDSGRFLAEVWKAKDSTADNEIRGMAEGFIDPTHQGAANNVRYAPIAGVGEQAFAVVETQDTKRGILNDIGMLVARKNGRILVLLSDDIAHRDRTAALQALTTLGRAAAARL